MKIQKSTTFALFAVLELARDPAAQLATGEIADSYGISVHHLAKVMRQLVRAGLIQSVRGAGGGYRFSANPNRVTLYDVVALFEDNLASEFEVPGASVGTGIGRALQMVGDEIEDLTRATLQSITLTTLLRHAARAEASPTSTDIMDVVRETDLEPLT
jgi:Rrf2 family transcriptional regulator, nitric oxide-sensitive transcriptional repressor